MKDMVTAVVDNGGNGLVAPKYHQIKMFIVNKINSGELKTDDCVPSENQLSREFKVNKNTVVKAFKELEHENLLYRIQGKGTFVAQTNSRKASVEDVVGVYGGTSGHLYGNMFGAIMRHMRSRRIMVAESSLSVAEKAVQLEDIIRSRPSAMLIDGDATFPFDKLYYMLREVERITFYHRFETSLSFDGANFVLPDYEEGGRLAAVHLVDKGHKKLMFRTFRYPGSPDSEPMGPKWSYHWGVYAGIRRALDEAGLDPSRNLVESTGTDSDSRLSRGLSGTDGVICMADFMAKKIYDLAEKEGRKIGGDLGVVGFFDTPWATLMSPSLTSVSVDETEVARLAVKTLEERRKGARILVPPQLKVRESA